MTNENDNQQPSAPETPEPITYQNGSIHFPDPVWTAEMPWVAFNADAEQFRPAA